MDPDHRKLISSNLKELASLIDVDLLKSFIIENEIFTKPMLDDIYEIKNDTERKDTLLLELLTRGPHAFQKFIKVLELSGHHNATLLLKPGLRRTNSIETFVQPKRDEYFPDNKVGGYFVEQNKSHEKTVIPAKEWKEGPNIYKMTSTPRGFCLLINNEVFSTASNRVGSSLDVVRLDRVFQGLGYTVFIKNDLTAHEMIGKLSSFVDKFKGAKVDSSVVIILSHGRKGEVWGVDCEPVYLNFIFELFDNYNCPYLKGKPKMFFFQACQGPNYDIGVPLLESTDAAVIHDTNKQKFNLDTDNRVPTLSDMLISQSTVEGNVSVRTENGAWFCAELASALAEMACDKDLISILEHVDGCVQSKFTRDGVKQATERTAKGWRKKLYFNPGLTKV